MKENLNFYLNRKSLNELIKNVWVLQLKKIILCITYN